MGSNIDINAAAERQLQARLFIRGEGGSNQYFKPNCEHDFIQDREALADWAIDHLTQVVALDTAMR